MIKPLHNVRPWGKGRRSGAIAIAILDMPMIDEIQWCDLPNFANEPAKCSDFGFRYSDATHGKRNLAFSL